MQCREDYSPAVQGRLLNSHCRHAEDDWEELLCPVCTFHCALFCVQYVNCSLNMVRCVLCSAQFGEQLSVQCSEQLGVELGVQFGVQIGVQLGVQLGVQFGVQCCMHVCVQ